MLIFLYGPDKYRLREGLGQIIVSYKKKHSSGVNIFDFDFSGREMTAEKLADTVKSVAFFNEVKLVIARDVFSAGAAQQVEELIKEQKLGELRDVVLLVCENQDAKALRSEEHTSELQSHVN